MKSDLTLDVSKFGPPETWSENTRKCNEHFLGMVEESSQPQWWEIGAAKFREMRNSGQTALKPPPQLPGGRDILIPSREPGRGIPCRYFVPEKEGVDVQGTFMHIHGGGWVLGDEKATDWLLQKIANEKNFVALSVGYRLAPEHPYPAANEDCFDVADYLVADAKEKFGGELKGIGGESAGGHLTACTTLHLLKTHQSLTLTFLLYIFGSFDISLLPSVHHIPCPPAPPILTFEHCQRFISAYCPNKSAEELKNPLISPLYENLNAFRGRLPKALFLVGTNDLLLDDSVFMCSKWMMAGGSAVLRVVPGAAHGFSMFPPDVFECGREAREVIGEFMGECE